MNSEGLILKLNTMVHKHHVYFNYILRAAPTLD